MSGYVEPPDTSYTGALHEAMDHPGRILVKVFFHKVVGIPVADVRDTSHGALFSADVPVEQSVGLASLVAEVKASTGRRVPAPTSHVAFLVEHPENHWHRGPICAWCPACGQRVVLNPQDLLREVRDARSTGRIKTLLVRGAHSVYDGCAAQRGE